VFEHRASSTVGYDSKRIDYDCASESVGRGDQHMHGEMTSPGVTEHPNGIAIEAVTNRQNVPYFLFNGERTFGRRGRQPTLLIADDAPRPAELFCEQVPESFQVVRQVWPTVQQEQTAIALPPSPPTYISVLPSSPFAHLVENPPLRVTQVCTACQRGVRLAFRQAGPTLA
jgi:hypothetical protein